ncbi:M15 family metallopeptidase [Streptomyces racemochromogenes]
MRMSTTARLAVTVAATTVFATMPEAGAGAAARTPEPKAPRAFVALDSVDPTILREMRYVSAHNFVGERIDGYRQAVCILTRPAAEALHRAQTRLLSQGYSLKVYDCYRPQRAVDHFVRWARDLADERRKAEFYPRVEKSRLFEDGYIAEKSGHSRGSTADLTIVPLPALPAPPPAPGQEAVPCYAPQAQRYPDNSVDMGTGFDCFDTLSHTDDPRVQGAQRAHRDLLGSVLAAEGFVNLPEEWWHFTYKPELFPDTRFDFPVSRRSVSGHRP